MEKIYITKGEIDIFKYEKIYIIIYGIGKVTSAFHALDTRGLGLGRLRR